MHGPRRDRPGDPPPAAAGESNPPHPRRDGRAGRRLLEHREQSPAVAQRSGDPAGVPAGINYERADVPHHLLFICTAAIADRGTVCERTIEISGVVNVRELLAGTRNLHVEAIAMESAGIERIAEELDSLGLEIEESELLRNEFARPFDGFGRDALESESVPDSDSSQAEVSDSN